MSTNSINTYPPDINRILLLFFIIALLLFSLLAFFTLFFCRSMFISRRNSSANAANVAPPQPQAVDEDAVGLDPSLVASFPTFTYSWVKNLHTGKCGLECAVCLSEFQDDDVLRLLTACSHVFHTDCIDVWLTSHTTCPYCRHELNPDEKKSPEVRILVAEVDAQEAFGGRRGGEEDVPQEHRRSVSLKEEGEEGRDEGSAEQGRRSGDLKRMLRSNSTGHSSMGRQDRFTLRLPKDVNERIARERNWTGSCIDFRDLFPDADDAREEDGEFGRSGFSERGRSRM